MGVDYTVEKSLVMSREPFEIDGIRYVAERTCRNVAEPPRSGGFWPSPHFRCSECGEPHVSVNYVDYCPHCGAKVVS